LVYAIFFRPDGGSVQNALKILKGLNSNTFNYLDARGNELEVEKDFQVIASPNTRLFFSRCVRLSKPCIFPSLASNWPSVKESWAADAQKMK
jgi:hypothetical protein